MNQIYITEEFKRNVPLLCIYWFNFYFTAKHVTRLIILVFGNGPGDQVSIPGRIIPKTLKKKKKNRIKDMMLPCLALSIIR